MAKSMIKRNMALLLAFAMSFCLMAGMTACGGGGDDGKKEDPKAEEPNAGESSEGAEGSEGSGEPADDPEAEADPSLATGEWTSSSGDFTLKIMGAELFEDVNGYSAIRVYYDFSSAETNVFSISMVDDLDVPYYGQDGTALDYTFAAEDAPEYGNDRLCIRPGATIRCIEEYALIEDEGTVSVAQYLYGEEDPLVAYSFDLSNLPGKPADDFEPAPVPEPLWLDSWPWEGVYHDDFYVSVDSAEVVEGHEGEDVLRVFFTFTNNSSEATSMENAIYWNRAFQDGIQLMAGIPDDAIDEDGNYYLDIEPGETIEAAYCYATISKSPVEVELMDPWADGIGADGADGGFGGAFAIK